MHVAQTAAAAAVTNCHPAGLFPGELQLHYSETIPECLSDFLLPIEKMLGTARQTYAASILTTESQYACCSAAAAACQLFRPAPW
jgi:hypothetical protein